MTNTAIETGKSCFWRHRWTKWSDKADGNKTQSGRVLGKVIIQERRCERCNMVELRAAEATINLWA